MGRRDWLVQASRQHTDPDRCIETGAGERWQWPCAEEWGFGWLTITHGGRDGRRGRAEARQQNTRALFLRRCLAARNAMQPLHRRAWREGQRGQVMMACATPHGRDYMQVGCNAGAARSRAIPTHSRRRKQRRRSQQPPVRAQGSALMGRQIELNVRPAERKGRGLRTPGAMLAAHHTPHTPAQEQMSTHTLACRGVSRVARARRCAGARPGQWGPSLSSARQAWSARLCGWRRFPYCSGGATEQDAPPRRRRGREGADWRTRAGRAPRWRACACTLPQAGAAPPVARAPWLLKHRAAGPPCSLRQGRQPAWMLARWRSGGMWATEWAAPVAAALSYLRLLRVAGPR
jgi:hypothetical protein